MKKTANVVIIGGGIIGCSIALSLARRAPGVVLVEKEGIASQASGANYGMIWLQTRLPGFDVTFARTSLRMYDELISEEFDIDIEYERLGGLTVLRTPEQYYVMGKVVEQRQSIGYPVRLVDSEELHQLEPALSPDLLGATYCPEDSQLNPNLLTLAFARAAKRHGADIQTQTEVTGIRVERGRVAGVQTDRGEIATRVVVNATGSWGRQVAKMAGVDVPVFPQRLESMVTESIPERLLHRVLQGGRRVTAEEMEHPEKVLSFAVELPKDAGEESLPREPLDDCIFPFIKPTQAGNFVIGTTSEFVGHDKGVLPRTLHLFAQRAVEIVPRLKDLHIIRAWSNFVPFTFDSNPILGEVPELEGFFVAVGHAHALSHAPPTAETLAELIVNGKPSIPIDEANILRFREKA